MDLDRLLRSIGKESFEMDYDVYEAYSNETMSAKQATDELSRRGRYKGKHLAMWRLGPAREIFRVGLEEEALWVAQRRQK